MTYQQIEDAATALRMSLGRFRRMAECASDYGECGYEFDSDRGEEVCSVRVVLHAWRQRGWDFAVGDPAVFDACLRMWMRENSDLVLDGVVALMEREAAGMLDAAIDDAEALLEDLMQRKREAESECPG